MSASLLAGLLESRLAHHAVDVASSEREHLLAYLRLLARWNRKINLTAFDLDHPTDAAIDRLIIEPVRAASLVGPDDHEAIDIGSGGGSPAIPVLIKCPWLRMTMVEARQRKAAFLREVARTLSLPATVEVVRFEALGSRPEHRARFHVVSIRAVRADEATWLAIRAVIRPGGRVLWFDSIGHITEHYWFHDRSGWRLAEVPFEGLTVLTV